MNENDLYENFLQFENKHNFLNLNYKDINIWFFVRHYYYKVVTCNLLNLNHLGKPPQNPEPSEASDYIKEKYLDIKSLKPHDILLIGDPRRVKQNDGFYYDIYTDFLPESLNSYSKIIMEDPFWSQFTLRTDSHSTPAISKELIYTDPIIKSFYETYFDEKNIMKEKSELLEIFKNVSNIFKKNYDLDFSIAEQNSTFMICFLLFTQNIYCEVIKKINPKLIMFIFHPNPTCMSMLNCAKKLNIPIAEIQHGIIGEFEPIWHKFLNNSHIAELPDYVFALSERLYIDKNMPLNLNSNKVKIVGYPFLEYKKQQLASSKQNLNNKKYILFVSQTNIGLYLSEFASKLSELLSDYPEYEIIYKLHPFEIKNKYECLNKPNIKVINNLDNDIYYYANLCDIQIGVYSTAIYEALKFNITTIIADGIMGSSEAKNILKGIRGVYSARNAQEAFNIILSNPDKTPINNPVWQEIDPINYKKIIDDIIKKR